MPYLPFGYFPSITPISGTAYDWTFERVRPAARQCKVWVPAASTEWHVFRVVAQPPTGWPLSAGQIATIGVDVGYAHKQIDGTFAEPIWFALQSDTAQNDALPFAVEFLYFRVQIGPNANNALAIGTYKTMVRAHTSPNVTRVLANFEVI